MLPVSRMSSIPSMIGRSCPLPPRGWRLDWTRQGGHQGQLYRGAHRHGQRGLARPEDDLPELENGQGSAAEISTIAKEVDKVNQIINLHRCPQAGLGLFPGEWQWWWGP